MEELDKQIEIEAIQRANEAVNDVRQEREIERLVKQKEKEYDDIVAKMAELVLDENEEILGQELVEDAKEKISKKTRARKSKTEEVNEDGKEKVKRTRRTKKSA